MQNKAKKGPKREDQTIEQKFLDEIVNLIGGNKPWRDLFASSITRRFEEWLEDAWLEEAAWNDKTHVNWVNPPFTQWERVKDKLLQTCAESVCLVPDWGQRWQEQLLCRGRKWYIPSGVALFRVDGKRLPSCRWGCWVIHISGVGECHNPTEVTMLPWNRVGQSRSGKRRERDRKVQARQLQ